jgi:hypothetical protein
MRDVTRRRVLMHGGEFMRELALLIVVFYPLDVYLQYGRLTVTQAVITFVTCATLWMIGVTLDVSASD